MSSYLEQAIEILNGSLDHKNLEYAKTSMIGSIAHSLISIAQSLEKLSEEK